MRGVVERIATFMLGWFLLIFGRAAAHLLLNLKVEGAERVPNAGPLIVIANHFSWFDAPLLTLYLPFQPAFLIASESQRFWFVRLFMRAFHGIPIWRGRVDRDALTAALATLRQGKVVGIFPEGGIDPRFAQRRARGEALSNRPEAGPYGFVSRNDAQLTHPEPGAAYLALQSQARILPVALLGTEKILANLVRFRRTDVTVRIGHPFGPLAVEATDPADRRQRINHAAEQIMHRIAALFPLENRGPYRDAPLETV